jgi:Tol biopolymer transport system component
MRSWIGAAAAVTALIVFSWLLRSVTTLRQEAIDVGAPDSEYLTGSFAISPDGSSLAFVTSDPASADTHLWIRPIDGISSRRIAGADGAAMPFWSPNGRYVAFFAHGKLRTVDLTTAAVSVIADAPRGRGGSWNAAGVILFAPDIASPIFSVPAGGGRAVAVTDLGEAPSHRFPTFLPDGRHFLYLVLQSDREESEIWAGQLGAATAERVMAATSNALYMDPGFLFFARGGSLFAQAFDASQRKPTGAAMLVSEHVGTYGEAGPTGLGEFSVSPARTLAIGDHVRPQTELVWFDRRGHPGETAAPAGDYESFSVTLDDTRAVATRWYARKRSSDLSIIDLGTGVVTQLTDDPWPDANPVWDPTGERVAFVSLRDGRWRTVVRDVHHAGTERLLPFLSNYVYSWTPDGRALIAGKTSAQFDLDLWTVPLDVDAPPAPLAGGAGNQTDGVLSPDGRWLAYISDHEGRRELYLRDVRGGSPTRVSAGGGDVARWRADGRELFYFSGAALMSVTFADGTFTDRRTLFRPPFPVNDNLGEADTIPFAVARDGGRFLLPAPARTQPQRPIAISRTWMPR